MASRIAFDCFVDAIETQIERDPLQLLGNTFPNILWIEQQWLFELHTRSPVTPKLHPHKTTFQRMYSLNANTTLEPGDEQHCFTRTRSCRHCPTQYCLDVLSCVIGLPGFGVGALPLWQRHQRVTSDCVIQ